MHVRNLSSDLQAKLIIRSAVKWCEFHGNKKLRQLRSATQDSRDALNQLTTEKHLFFKLIIQISEWISTVVGRGYGTFRTTAHTVKM